MPTSHPDEVAMSVRHAVWDVEPGTADLPEEVLERAGAAVSRYTTWGEFVSVTTKVHVDTYTPDSTPVVASIDDSRIAVITGTHGSGIRLAPALAQDAAQLVLRK
jgi:glycine/D-amino acid oxidase-like deaminating enzyme